MAKGSDKVVITAIIGNALVTISKFIGWFITRSSSMFAEAIHSAADTANQILLLIGLKSSRKGPSKLFPWGTGQAQYVWNLISAMGIFFIGFGFTTYHGVHTLFHPSEKGEENLVLNLSILFIALVIEGYAFIVAYKEASKQKGKYSWKEFLKISDDPTTIGVLFEDAIAVTGIIVAFLCIGLSHYFNSSVPDAVGSILIGILLGFMAIFLAYINSILLIGPSVHKTKVEEIKSFIESYPYIKSIQALKTVVLGSGRLHLSMDIEIYGEQIIDREQIQKDANALRNGEDAAKILVKTSERSIRIVGEIINKLEIEIQQKFPDIGMIELELH